MVRSPKALCLPHDIYPHRLAPFRQLLLRYRAGLAIVDLPFIHLVTGSTQAKLDRSFLCRRLGSVAVVNIAEPVSLHELVLPSYPQWAELRNGYESALAEFERHDFHKSARILGQVLEKYPADGPSMLLMSRAVQAMFEPPKDDKHLVWQLPGK